MVITMLTPSNPTMWARFTDGTTIRAWPGSGHDVIVSAPLFGLTELLFRMAVNAIDADVNEQPAD